MSSRKKIFDSGVYFSGLRCAILIIFCHVCTFSNTVADLRQEANLLRVEIKSIDLPTFQTGEAGPLYGRVVLEIACESPLPLEACATVEFEGQKEPPAAVPRTIYPGVSSTLDFPLELAESRSEDDVLACRLRIDVGGQWSLSRQVFFYVRSHGMFFRTYRSRLDDTVYPYALYLPREISQGSGPWPLVLSLHGAWSNYANNLKRLMGIGNRPGEPDELALVSLPVWPELPEIEGIVVCPWGRGTMGYHGPGAQDVLDVLELVFRQYPVDRERVSVTGLSMGGNGTWEMALHHADLFAAAVPVCAPADFNFLSEDKITPGYRKKFPYLDRIRELNSVSTYALNALPLKVRIHHGTDDPTVPYSHSVMMAGVLKKLGIEAPLTGYDSVGHNSWDPAYAGAETLKWLLAQRRARPELDLTFIAGRYGDAVYQWLEVKRFAEYGRTARVHARYDQTGRSLALETENVRLLDLDLARLPGLAPGSRVSLVSPGGKKLLSLSVPEQGRVSLEIRNGKPGPAKQPAAEKGPIKRRGLEGPMCEALCDKTVLVYGTLGPGAQETLEQVKRFADWGELPDVHFIIKPDIAVTEDDIRSSHLVLFGGPAENSLLAQIVDRSPLRFRDGQILAGPDRFQAAEVAFKCVFPNPLNPDRLVLWNYADEWDYGNSWSYRNQFEMLPDYFIYRRGSDKPVPAEVLKAGFFNDRWQWE